MQELLDMLRRRAEALQLGSVVATRGAKIGYEDEDGVIFLDS